MFAMIPLMLLMATIFNGGFLVVQKTRLQNSVDTSALLEASWTARSLNIMSMNNTALTQSQAITSAAWAMEKPLMDAGLNSGLVAGFYGGRAFTTARIAPPWTVVLAALVYGVMYAALNERVLEPLFELQEELKRSIHSDDEDDQGFAKAAASFGRMNKILAEKFPESINSYSEQLLHANYSEDATQIRYTAWADLGETLNVAIPVVEQSLGDALESITGADEDDADNVSEDSVDSDTQSDLSDALASIKDIKDVYYAGLLGTHTNPYSYAEPYTFPSLNYFGNFRAQGYEDGTGPFPLARIELEEEFRTIFTNLEGHIDGSFVGDEIKEKIKSTFGCFICDPLVDMLVDLVNAIFEPLLGTPYNHQDTNPEAAAKRIDEVWQWSSFYGESNYTNSFRVTDSINLGLFELYAAPRMWRGILPGIYHGRDLSNIGEGQDDYDPDGAREAVEGSVEEERTRYVSECVGRGLEARTDELTAAKRQNKGQTWDNLDPKPFDPDRDEFISRNEYMVLSASERLSAANDARIQLTEECGTEYDDLAGSAENTSIDDPNESGVDEFGSEAEGYSDTFESGESGQEGGSWRDPKELQKYLMLVNWFFEPSYYLMSRAFPLDAAVMAFAGNNRGEQDSNLWCGLPFGEGLLCTNEVPMYAVNRQRITPQFAVDFLDDVGLNLNSLPDAIRDNYAADRHDWSLVVAASAPAELLIASRGFGEVPTEMSAIAQAEVFNSQWFDLFTQTWKAKLTPISIFEDEVHYEALKASWTDEEYLFMETLSAAAVDGQRVLNH